MTANLTARDTCLTLTVVDEIGWVLGDVLIQSESGLRDSGYLWIASAYAVHRDRVLLVLHNRFNMWVPPGGHLSSGESLGEAAIREFREETGLAAQLVSAAPVIHPSDDNASPIAAPFYVDVEREGFRKPALVHFFFARLTDPSEIELNHFQESELRGIGLFSKAELHGLETFEQVRSLSRYVLEHHPSPT